MISVRSFLKCQVLLDKQKSGRVPTKAGTLPGVGEPVYDRKVDSDKILSLGRYELFDTHTSLHIKERSAYSLILLCNQKLDAQRKRSFLH